MQLRILGSKFIQVYHHMQEQTLQKVEKKINIVWTIAPWNYSIVGTFYSLIIAAYESEKLDFFSYYDNNNVNDSSRNNQM